FSGIKAPLGAADRLTSNLLSADRFRSAYLTAARGTIVAAFFLFRLRDDGRDRQPISGNIHSDKGQIGRANVPALFGAIIFHPDLHPHLHRSVEDAIDRRAQDYEISDANG